MSNEQVDGTSEAAAPRARNQTSAGNSLPLSVVLFVLLFGLFVGGLYVMAMFTPVTFIAGLGMCLVALFITFDLVPRFLTK